MKSAQTLPLRIQRLELCLAQCRGRLQVQDQALADIRRGAMMLSSSSHAMHETLESLGMHVDTLAVADPAPRKKPGRLLRLSVCLVVAAVGLGYNLRTPPRPAAAPRTESLPRPAIVPSPPAAEDTRQSEALRLLYEYRLPGTDWNMLDLIGPQEAILGPSPWAMVCLSENVCTVSFVRRGDSIEEPLYKFEVNLAAKTVVPAPETLRKLLADSLSRTAAAEL